MKSAVGLALVLAARSAFACDPLMALASTENEISMPSLRLTISATAEDSISLVWRDVRPGYILVDSDNHPLAGRSADKPDPEMKMSYDGSLLWTAPGDGVYELLISSHPRNRSVTTMMEVDPMESVIVFIDSERRLPESLYVGLSLLSSGRPFAAVDALHKARKPVKGFGIEEGIDKLVESILARWPGVKVLMEAELEHHAGNLAASARLLLASIAENPELGETHAMLGQVLLEQERVAEAEPVLATALKLEPSADTAFNLAIARYRLKNWDDAWKACALCLKWSESGSRLQERAAEIGVAIAARLEEREQRLEVYSVIVKWAGETEGGKVAAKELE